MGHSGSSQDLHGFIVSLMVDIVSGTSNAILYCRVTVKGYRASRIICSKNVTVACHQDVEMVFHSNTGVKPVFVVS